MTMSVCLLLILLALLLRCVPCSRHAVIHAVQCRQVTCSLQAAVGVQISGNSRPVSTSHPPSLLSHTLVSSVRSIRAACIGLRPAVIRRRLAMQSAAILKLDIPFLLRSAFCP
ncbi:MAG: hypothetical protein ACKO2P_15255 [Planctomycetota bacterium]